ncbi:tape measure protein [Hymenobacter tenuis]
MAEVGTVYKLDTAAAFAALDRLASKDAEFRAAVVQTGQVSRTAFQDAAQQALAYQQRLAAAAAEVRQAGSVYNELRAELRGAVEEAKKLEQASKAAGGNSTAAGAKLTAELEANRRKQAELKVEIDLTRKAIDGEREAVAKVRTEQQQQVAQQKLATAAARDMAAAEKQVAQAAKEAAAAQKQATEASKEGVGGFLGGLLGKIGGLTAGLFTVGKVIDGIKASVASFAELSGIQNTFKAITGSARDGAREFVFIKEEANRFGLELAPIARSYASLYAAAKEANLPLADTRNIFQGVSAAAKTFNLSSAETEQALKAVQQMLSKGTVSSQELKLQLGNVLPGAFAVAAKSIGVTTVELGKMLEKGQVVSADFLPKFAAQLKRTYGAGTEDAAASVRSNLGRINTFFQETSARIGASFAPAIAAVAKFVSAGETAAQKSERVAANFFKQADAARSLATTVTPLLGRYEELSSTTNRNATQQEELRKVIDELAKTVPSAVTQFDSYGRALGINGEAVKKFLKDQELLSKAMNKEAITTTGTAIARLGDQRRALQKELASNVTAEGLRTTTFQEQRGNMPAVTRTTVLSREESNAITEELRQQLEKVNEDIRGQVLLLDQLEGRALKPVVDPAKDPELRRLGLILALQQKIADLRKQQEAPETTENDLLRKGGLNDQIKAAQEELDRLLGKQDRAAKARKGTDYLKQLLAAEAKLRDEANKIELEMLKDQGQAKAAEQLRQDQEEIARTEANLKRLEKLAGRDGFIDGVQRDELGRLRLAAMDRYYERIRQIAQAHADRLFDLLADSDRKEIEALERQHQKEVLAAQGQADVLIALEEKKQRDLLALRQKQEQTKIERTATLEENSIRAGIGQIFGEGTGQSVIEAKERENKALIESDLKKNEALLNNSLLLAGEQGEIVRSALRVQIGELRNALKEIDKEKGKIDPKDSIFRLILGERDGPEERRALEEAIGATMQAVDSLRQAELAVTQAKIDARTRNIDDLQTRLSQELQYNKEGSASNIAGIREQIAAEKAARREAIADRRKAAKEQILIDTLLQSSNVITAASQALSAFPIPIVGPALGIGAAALIVTAFVASKIKAIQAVNQQSEGFFKGGYTGDEDKHQESTKLGKRSYVYHHKEFVFNNETTKEYRHTLFEPLHQGRPELIDWQAPQMQALLPDMELPKKLHEERKVATEQRVLHQFAPMREEFKAMQDRLAGIEKHVASTAARRDVVPVPEGYMLVDQASRSTHTVKLAP